MYLGRIVEVAPTEQLFSDPRHPYTRGLLAAIPRLAEGAADQSLTEGGPAVARRHAERPADPRGLPVPH